MEKQCKILVMTFNLAASDIPPDGFSFIPKDYDMYVLGFQEVGPFIPLACDAKQNALSKMLTEKFQEEYFIMTNMVMLGLKLFIAVKKIHKKYVWANNEYIIPTGADGAYGNKGAVAVSMNFDQTKICFICAHFAAQERAVLDRNRNYADIMTKIKSYAGCDPREMHNFIFFFGDLNYRIDLPYDDTKRLAMAGLYANLLTYDQLNRERSSMHCFNGFSEQEIAFPPTYKFDRESILYDSSKKKRVPSYCDRILFYANSRKTLKINSYTSFMDVLYSDHRPVLADFTISLVDKPEVQKSNEKASRVCRIF